MTITSSTESQINPAVRNKSQGADAKAEQKSKADAQSSSETPAVVVDAKVSAAEEKLAASGPSINSVEDALNVAKSIGAALSEGNSSIANGSAGQVSGLLSEFEAAVA